LGSKSALTQTRTASRRQQRNKSVRSQVKTNITKAERLIFTGELEAAREAVAAAVISLDKAAEKKILHANNVGRRKSRLLKKLNQAVAQPRPAPKPEKPATKAEKSAVKPEKPAPKPEKPA
jgi:small subunit ribosomal protein S20